MKIIKKISEAILELRMWTAKGKLLLICLVELIVFLAFPSLLPESWDELVKGLVTFVMMVATFGAIFTFLEHEPKEPKDE